MTEKFDTLHSKCYQFTTTKTYLAVSVMAPGNKWVACSSFSADFIEITTILQASWCYQRGNDLIYMAIQKHSILHWEFIENGAMFLAHCMYNNHVSEVGEERLAHIGYFKTWIFNKCQTKIYFPIVCHISLGNMKWSIRVSISKPEWGLQ